MIKPLSPKDLYRSCDPNQFTFETTADLEDLTEIIGQARAVEAIHFGTDIQQEGYNLFVIGSPETAKQAVIRQFLKRKAVTEPTPPDWCYVNNFSQPHKPHALRLPPGQGIILRRDVEQLIEELRTTIPAVFESENYRTRRQVIEEEFKERQDKAFKELEQQAKERGIALLQTPLGLAFAPMRRDRVLNPEEFQRLPESERKRIESEVAALQEKLQDIIRKIPQWEREIREKIKALNHEVVMFAVGHLIDELRKKYTTLPEVVSYLNALQQDISNNAEDFLRRPEEMPAFINIPESRFLTSTSAFRRYQVNVIVDHSTTQGAPVVYEDYPTYQNLIGRIEHISQLGTLVTDFNLIKPGALHRANGGYLMLDAHKVLTQPFAWEGLKRVLRARKIHMASLGQMLDLVSTVSLEPEPIPLNVKVVLLGDQLLYYLLCQFDPEFNELFKVVVDFEERMDRTLENNLLYARLIGTLTRKEGLRPLERSAVARVIEHSARIVGDAEKLSTHIRRITDLLREANYWAGAAGHKIVNAFDVQRAIDAQIRRVDRIRERIQEEIQRGTILIDTDGEKIGQINGLSVIDLGQVAFGRPSRITARVRLGKGEVIDIEREVELGGPIHSKGVLILSSFLSTRYAIDKPLSLFASLVFEQSYNGVEGDSASSAELYALLSALAEVPIRQSLAVTGSVNQHGQVQAIGGVNEKIEGFFDICKARGLTGKQGVLIPASNVKHLMLRQDVVEAAAAGKFHIYPVETVDEGIEILTGIPAGERDETGNFPQGSINQRVEARLIALAEKRMALAASAKGENAHE
ncbi:MAG TPA: ATP-binding protein [Candidatus Limnocylindrales bacterium]|nr:ATP-binding protein [Candidatus Limnocylindrales bacterium]